MSDVFYALSLITPYDINLPKVRIGPLEDGGYILADVFDDKQAVLSYGISTEYSFDRAMAERGHMVYMFDHTIPGIKDPHPNMRFFREGVAGAIDGASEELLNTKTNHELSLYSIDDHIKKHGINAHRLILKMDVEGYEYGALYGLSEETLGKIDQIVMEVHMFGALQGSELLRNVFIKVFERINKHFTLFHVHANNVDGFDRYEYVDGMPVSNLLEVSYVRTDLVKRSPSTTVYPTTIDYPNLPKRDKLLWIYPFIPSVVKPGSFEESLRHVEATDPALKALEVVEEESPAGSIAP